MDFSARLASCNALPLKATEIAVLQVNIGYRCNMACRHCHVEAGPDRAEMMDRGTADAVLGVLERTKIGTLDITGGAPELNPHFRRLIEDAKALGRRVIVRSNLTIFSEPGMTYLPRFYRDCGVEIVASLPYYLGEQVDRVRGGGTFERSIAALRGLNALGYGNSDARLSLTLVYNPPGMFLPAPQAALEEEYRRELDKRHGVTFSRLFTLVNMPVGRFRNALQQKGLYERYMETLRCSFNPAGLEGLMCRHLVSVGWDGKLYDCDFNQMAGLPVAAGNPATIDDFDSESLSMRKISTAEHCYGCTAGQGST